MAKNTSYDSNGMGASWTELQADFKLYLGGDSVATHRLFEALERAFRGFYRVRLPSNEEAEDLTQVALLKVHLARERFDIERSLKTWVFTVARNALIDHWRGVDSEATEHLDGAHIDALSTPDDLAQKIQSQTDLNKALAVLKPLDRSIVYLYGIEGMPMAEIAESLGLSENAAKVRAHRAYLKLRDLLALLVGAILSGGLKP